MNIKPDANIFENIPDRLPDELFDTLLQNDCVRIERIVSRGHQTPANDWYDQDWDEWILLLQGRAILKFDKPSADIELKPGDHLLITAHTLHRVEWTDPDRDTIWLAVHLSPKPV